MDEQKDPLDELRHMAAGGTGVARELRRIAIAWDNERCRNNIDRRVLQAKYEAECSANDNLRTEVKKLTAERDELQAKLDASMPLPLDADGVPCHIGDEAWCFVILWGGKRTETSCHGFVQSMLLDENGFWLLNVTNGQDDEDGTEVTETWPVTNVSHHAPKPETIEDVRGDISNDPCGYFGKGSATSCDGCPRDGKGGGCSRAMSADLVRRAYECGKRDGVDDARD